MERQERGIEALAAAGAPNEVPVGSDEPVRLNSRPSRTLIQTDAGSAPPMATPGALRQDPSGDASLAEMQVAMVEALPEGQNALLDAGRLVIEPAFEFSQSSGDHQVFRGAVIDAEVDIGLMNVNDAERDTVAASLAVRYGLTDRLEIEGRVHYIHRDDRVTTTSTGSPATTQTYELDASDIGDIEVSARYQLTRGRNGGPIFIVGARVKSDTGLGPFETERDASGAATELATGSGFWAVQGSLSVAYPIDPAVLFANLSYTDNIGEDIDRTFGAVTIGHADPGDAIGFGFGFGFAVNPRFSYSLGYSHSYVLESETEMTDANGATLTRESSAFHVGSMQFGLSFRVTENLALSTGVDVGLTDEAPDLRVTFRAPFSW